jgi:hypothetical protein
MPFRWGHRPEDSLLALGMDARALEATRMTKKLLEDTADACGGAVLTGFSDIYNAFRSLAGPLPVCTATGGRTTMSHGAKALGVFH